MNWEYKFVWLTLDTASTEELMNKLGSERWELVTAWQPRHHDDFRAIFKRPSREDG